MKRRRFRLLRALLVSVSVAGAAGCGSPDSNPANEHGLGMLRLGRSAELQGTHYLLEARFDVAGPVRLTLDSAYATTSTLHQALVPGAYSVTIQPGFRVLQDFAVAELPVASTLLSDATQTVQISSGEDTCVSYRFLLAQGSVSFDPD